MKVKYKVTLLYAALLVLSLGVIVAVWNTILQSSQDESAESFREESLQQGIALSDAKSKLFFYEVDQYLKEGGYLITSSQFAQEFQGEFNWLLLDYHGQVVSQNYASDQVYALVTPELIRLAADRMEIDDTITSAVDNYEIFGQSGHENIIPTRVHLKVYEEERIVLAYGQSLYSVMARIKAKQIDATETTRRFLVIGVATSVVMTLVFLLIGIFVSSRIIARPIQRIIRGIESQKENCSSEPVSSGTTDEFRSISTTINDLIERESKLLQDTILSEQRFRRLFENSETSIWNHDFSKLESFFANLRKDDVEDLESYLSSNVDMIFSLTKMIKITKVNQATLALFGAPSQAILVDGIEKTYGLGTQQVFKDLLCAIWNKERVFRSSANLKTLSGRPIRVIISFQIPKTKVEFESVSLSMVDVTEQKKLEKQLRQSQKMEAVGQLTSGVAHDFNNLLAVMLGNAELLEDVIEEDEEAEDNIRAIKEAVNRASSLTGRLLAFSRQSTLAPVAADICEVIGGLSDLLQRAMGETVALRVKDTAGLWPAIIDTNQFENALVNLALNARDAMHQGGVLTIETTNITLDETYAEQYDEVIPGDYVEVAVSDTGTGMPSDVLEKAFEPFFTTKEVGKGSGLGLSMVFGFVKQSNGHITIYSEVGHGTTFKLYMPRSQLEPVAKGIKADVLRPAQGTERILVVEDDPDVRKIPVAILRGQGYEIVEAGTGDEAIGFLNSGLVFDLLFTDIVLPGGMNGVDISNEAKRIQPGIKALFATGYAENAVFVQGKLDHGMNMVKKPYRRTELLEKVRETLDSKEA